MITPQSYLTWCPYQLLPHRVPCHIQHFTPAHQATSGTPRWGPLRCCSITWPQCWRALRRAMMSGSATCRRFTPSYIRTGLMMTTESSGTSLPPVTPPHSTPTILTTAKHRTTGPRYPRISSLSGSPTLPNIFPMLIQEPLGAPHLLPMILT